MYRRSDELGPEMNNRLALRIAVFGGFALALFAILFFRLWFLQVLNGDKYLAEANNNRTREYRVSAPRGEILDRNGRIVVANRTSLALQINPRKLPADEAERQRRAGAAREADPHHAAQAAQDPARTAAAGAERAGHRAPRRRRLPRLLPGREPGPLPGGRGAAGVRPSLPARHARRPHPRQRQRDKRRTAEGAALPRPAAGRRNRPGRRRGHLRPFPARPARDQEDPGRRLRPADPQRPARLRAAGSGGQPRSSRSTRRCRKPAKRRWRLAACPAAS